MWSAASAGSASSSASSPTSTVGADLRSLQTVYGEVVPAVQLGAASSGKTLSAGQAVDVVLADGRLVPLQHLIVGLSDLYGAGVLAMKASSSTEPTAAGHARAELPAVVIGPALALLLIPLLGAALEPRERLQPVVVSGRR